jgi:hypothetical protein
LLLISAAADAAAAVAHPPPPPPSRRSVRVRAPFFRRPDPSFFSGAACARARRSFAAPPHPSFPAQRAPFFRRPHRPVLLFRRSVRMCAPFGRRPATSFFIDAGCACARRPSLLSSSSRDPHSSFTTKSAALLSDRARARGTKEMEAGRTPASLKKKM